MKVSEDSKNSGLLLGDTMSKKKKEYAAITKCSSNKGFGGKPGTFFRSNFSGETKVHCPQSLTAATLFLLGVIVKNLMTTHLLKN
jgi:hypothetical protein